MKKDKKRSMDAEQNDIQKNPNSDTENFAEETISENEGNTDGNDELLKLQEENTKLKNEFLRAYAEAENTKKRCAQEIEKNNKYAISSFAKELLSVADNLNRAMAAGTDSPSTECETLLKGVEMTAHELEKVFQKFGIKKMEVLNTIFDPNFHQVIQEVEDPSKPNGTVIAELQTGYMINDRILREAMVVVSKGGK